MTNNQIGIAPSHVPTIASGEYIIKADLNNNLTNAVRHEVAFHVAGYNYTIPQNEVLAMYPPMEHSGNFAGTFPHIQFRRSTVPWEYHCESEGERIPYIFLVLLKEEELASESYKLFETDTNSLKNSLEDTAEPKPLKILQVLEDDHGILPSILMVSLLAHVRVQEHAELKDLHLPKETSILISHRMVEPTTKYKAFVCYYSNDIISGDKDKSKYYLNNTDGNVVYKSTNTCVVLAEWSFESIAAELYQIDTNKLKNHPDFNSFQKGLPESEITTLEQLKTQANPKLMELISANETYLQGREKNRLKEESIEIFEEKEQGKEGNNHILEYLEYNGKNLKGYLYDLKLQAFKTQINIKDEAVSRLVDIAKVPLEHQLKAGGRIISWYQGPFTNWNYSFDFYKLLDDKKAEYIPDHQDYLNLFNDNTKMYDMTYAAAWQLGRLMIVHENKVLQELKKWKYELELHYLVQEQNRYSHLPNLATHAPAIPDILVNYVIELMQFRNFPIYYLFPHADLSTEESIKYFKIDNSWVLAFLYGIFSAGPKLSLEDFKAYVLDNISIANIFDTNKTYYGLLLQSQTIKNWPHLIVELDKSHDFHYITNINNTLRLYITEQKFSTIEMYLKNENAHFGKAFEKIEQGKDRNFLFENNQSIELNDRYVIKPISGIGNSVEYANNMLYKQPRVKISIK